MKKLIFIPLFVCSVFLLLSFVSGHAKRKEGIVFFKGTFQEALDKAKSENKLVFVDVYASWCGPCKQLKKKTFKDKEVGDYYNKNFINITIDGETKEGVIIMRNYGINAYPTLLIVDYNGKLRTKKVGFVEPHILVNFGKRIVP